MRANGVLWPCPRGLEMNALTTESCTHCGRQRPTEFQTWGPIEDENTLRWPPRTPRQSGALTDMMTWAAWGYPQGTPSFNAAGNIASWSLPHGLEGGVPVNRPPSWLGLADYTRLMWSLEGYDQTVRLGGIGPNGYELLAIRFAYLKQSIQHTRPQYTRHGPDTTTDSITRVHLECLEQAAEVIGMGLRPQGGGEADSTSSLRLE